MSEETNISPNSPDELTDILLVLNKEKKKIQAVKGIDEKGNLKTVGPNEKNIGDFLRVDGNGNIFSNFFKNFFSELKNPTNFSFFKVPSPISMDVAKGLQEQVKNPTPEGERLMQQYEIKTDAPQEQVKVDAASKQAPASDPPKTTYKYKEEDIDWETLGNLGLDKESLVKKNILDNLLKGYKSKELVPVSANLGGAVIRTDARIWLQPGDDGKPVVALRGVRKEPELRYQFFGHKFTDEDKKNLLETGNMGRVVNLVNSKTGEMIPSIVSIDRLTNELVALRTTKMVIPDKFQGVKLNDLQKQTLMEGKPLYLEGMISKKDTPYSATIQFNADKRLVEHLFDKDKVKQEAKQHVNQVQQGSSESKQHEVPQIYRGQKLTQEQWDKLDKNQAAYIELVDKKGKPYQGYVTFDKQSGLFDFSWPNQIKEQAQPAEENKTQVAVNSDGKTNESTKNITEPLNSKQDQPKNEQQQNTVAAPKKSKGPKI